MAKFKPVRRGGKRAPAPKAGLPCVILVILGMALLMLIMFYVMTSSTPGR
jgi:hypothetical protein